MYKLLWKNINWLLFLAAPVGGRSSFILRSSAIEACRCSMTTSSPRLKDSTMSSCRNSRSSSRDIFSKTSIGEGAVRRNCQTPCACDLFHLADSKHEADSVTKDKLGPYFCIVSRWCKPWQLKPSPLREYRCPTNAGSE